MGQNSLIFIIFGLFGAGIVFGVPWLIGKILPFVGSPVWGSTTGWVLCGTGLFAGYLLAQISIYGWRETWRSWVMWVIFVVPLMGLGAIVGWYFQANPGHLETLKELGKKASITEDNFIIILVVGVPILLFAIMAVIAIWREYSRGKSHR